MLKRTMLIAICACSLCLAMVASPASGEDLKGIYLDDTYLKIPFGGLFEGEEIIRDHLNVTRGTIEFWLKVDDWYRTGSPGALFFWGSRHNQRSIAIALGGRNRAVLRFSVASDNYKSISAVIEVWKQHYDLKPSTWHHVACCWDVEDGKEHVAVFLDGKQIDAVGQGNNPGREFAGLSKVPTYLYVGTTKSSNRLITDVPPQIWLSRFRISDTVRYDKEFAPEAVLAVDVHTLLYLPFEEDHNGWCYRKGKGPGLVPVERIQVVSNDAVEGGP